MDYPINPDRKPGGSSSAGQRATRAGLGSLAGKLRIKPSMTLKILGAPPEYFDRLGALPEGASLATDPGSTVDFVQVFALSVAELDRLLPKATAAIKYDGIFWISWPKKSSKIKSDLTRDVIWSLIAGHGLRPVAAISIDDTWSALRVRPPEAVNTRRAGS